MLYFVASKIMTIRKSILGVFLKGAFSLFTALSITMFSSQSANADGEIEILAVHFPPFEFEKPENGLKGFDVETVVEAFHRKGVVAKVVFTPWARAIEMGRKGKAAGILSCAKNAKREEYFATSEPISFATRGYSALESNEVGSITKIEDGADYDVGTVIGYASSKELTDVGIKHDLSPDINTTLQKLRAGRIDLFFSELNATKYMAKQIIPGVSLKHYPTSQKAYHLCVSRNWPGSIELLTLFNEGLVEIQSDGTYDKIHAKYK